VPLALTGFLQEKRILEFPGQGVPAGKGLLTAKMLPRVRMVLKVRRRRAFPPVRRKEAQKRRAAYWLYQQRCIPRTGKLPTKK